MADSFWATPGELDELTKGPTVVPGTTADIPDPEPAVLERARQIVEELKKGTPFSTQTDQPAEPALTEEQRLRFVAHIVANEPYVRTYSLLNGAMDVGFATISATIEQLLTKLVLQEESTGQGSPADRNVRYTNYLMFCSLRTYVITSSKGHQLWSIEREFGDFPAHYQRWVGELSREHYRIILAGFEEFEQEVQALVAKANDPSFWPTP